MANRPCSKWPFIIEFLLSYSASFSTVLDLDLDFFSVLVMLDFYQSSLILLPDGFGSSGPSVWTACLSSCPLIPTSSELRSSLNHLES